MRSHPTPIAHLWRHHRLALLGFGLAILATLFFAVRMAVFTVYWANPAHHEQRLEGWMTPRYVARSWHVDPAVVARALGLKPGAGRITLEEIAEQRGVPLAQLIAQVDAALDKAGRGPGQVRP